MRAGGNPRLDHFAKRGLCAGGRLTASAWPPGPGDELIVCDVLLDLGKTATTVAMWILQLPTDGAQRLSLPRHGSRGQGPLRIPGDAQNCRRGFVDGEVVRSMAGHARQAGRAVAILSCLHRRAVWASIVALCRRAFGRMAVQTARALKHLARLRKEGNRSFTLIGNRGETRDRPQCHRSHLPRLVGLHVWFLSTRGQAHRHPARQRCRRKESDGCRYPYRSNSTHRGEDHSKLSAMTNRFSDPVFAASGRRRPAELGPPKQARNGASWRPSRQVAHAAPVIVEIPQRFAAALYCTAQRETELRHFRFRFVRSCDTNESFG